MALLISSALTPALMLGGTMKIYPNEDGFVTAGSWASVNFQTYQSGDWKDRLRVGYEGSWDDSRSLVKFDLANTTGKIITSAVLSFKKGPVSFGDPTVNLYKLDSNSWNENTLTWNNQPSLKTFISSKEVVGLDKINFDITNQVNGGYISFILTEATEGTRQQNSVFFLSKDYTTHSSDDYLMWPYVEVTYAGGCSTTADTDGDGNINLSELLSYISQWKSGTANLSSLLQVISYWKAGVGC